MMKLCYDLAEDVAVVLNNVGICCGIHFPQNELRRFFEGDGSFPSSLRMDLTKWIGLPAPYYYGGAACGAAASFIAKTMYILRCDRDNAVKVLVEFTKEIVKKENGNSKLMSEEELIKLLSDYRKKL